MKINSEGPSTYIRSFGGEMGFKARPYLARPLDRRKWEEEVESAGIRRYKGGDSEVSTREPRGLGGDMWRSSQ